MQPSSPEDLPTGPLRSWLRHVRCVPDAIHRKWCHWCYGCPLETIEDLKLFFESEAASYIQTPIFRHAQSVLRMGLQYVLDDSLFRDNVERARWNLFPMGLGDVLEVAYVEVARVETMEIRVQVAQRLSEICLEVLHRMRAEQSVGDELWTKLGETQSRRIVRLWECSPRKVLRIPQRTAPELYALLPTIDDQMRGDDQKSDTAEFIHNQMASLLCGTHEKLIRRLSRKLGSILLDDIKPPKLIL